MIVHLIFSIDVNECVESATPLCLNNGVCVNTQGSYRCNCTDQYTGPDCGDGESFTLYTSHKQENRSSEFLTRSNTNQPLQSQKITRSFKLGIKEEEELYYPFSENKGADQLCIYCTDDLRLCFCIGKMPGISHPTMSKQQSLCELSAIMCI